MPELLTKHPDIVLKILKESGVQCGTGAKQQILHSCPPDRFCKLPTGELCVYGLNNLSNMTQIKREDFSHPISHNWGASLVLLLFGVFMLGVVIGMFLSKKHIKR